MTDPPDARLFRTVMGTYPTGVAVVTARKLDGEPCGLTVNSLTSVSLEPLLLLVCLDLASESRVAVLESGAFAVNILGTGGEGISDSFANGQRGDRFTGLAWRVEATGSPVLERALAWLDCRVTESYSAGDHIIVVGQVEACGASGGHPLVFHGGRYRAVAEGYPDVPEQ